MTIKVMSAEVREDCWERSTCSQDTEQLELWTCKVNLEYTAVL